jgi:PRTRC genetic system ThiF family protein
MSLIHTSIDKHLATVTNEAMNRPVDVLVIGCGGTGSELVDALCRLHYSLLHLGHPGGLQITLQDDDTVSPFNVGRQRFAPADVGQNKAEVLATRYGLIFGMDIRYKPTRAGRREIHFMCDYDLVITGVDNASFRVRMAQHWRRRKTSTVWLDCGNGRFDGQVLLGHLGQPEDSDRLPNVYDLFPAIATTPDDDQPSCSMEAALASQMLFINRWMGDIAATLLVRLFTQGSITEHGAFVNMQKLTVTPIKIDRVGWEFLRGTAA